MSVKKEENARPGDFNSPCLVDDDEDSWPASLRKESPVQSHLNGPHLKIIEEPKAAFRFRYHSEQKRGSHGCVYGVCTASKSCKSEKTYPTVELMNYTGQARIRVQLACEGSCERHPADEGLTRRTCDVPRQGSYVAIFSEISIKLPKKEEVISWLMDNGTEKNEFKCKLIAQSMNLHAVRLRFSAHDVITDEEICPPVYSLPIKDLRESDLKIVKYTPFRGRPEGGDEMWLAVDGIKKRDIIQVVFFENTPTGRKVLQTIHVTEMDIHRQALVTIRTPKYRDVEISSYREVYFELYRPIDDQRSEPRVFEYKPTKFIYEPESVKLPFDSRKRKRSSSSSNTSGYSSINTALVPGSRYVPGMFRRPNTSESEDIADLTLTSEGSADGFGSNDCDPEMDLGPDLDLHTLVVPIAPTSPSISGHPEYVGLKAEEMLASTTIMANMEVPNDLPMMCNTDPVLAQAFHCNSILVSGTGTSQCWQPEIQFLDLMPDDRENFNGVVYEEEPYLEHYDLQQLTPDSPQIMKGTRRTSKLRPKQAETEKADLLNFSALRDEMIKKLITEICELVKDRCEANESEIKHKLEDVLEIRRPNGDTFLHTTLTRCQKSFANLVSLIHSMHLDHLLNLTNQLQQTILHLAVVNDMPSTVSMLVAKGCDVCLGDREGNTPLHYAVICRGCLAPLLAAAEARRPQADLNAYNNEKQTALHLAAIYDAADSARLLLAHGASGIAGDAHDRTPLHYAAYDGSLNAAKAIVEFLQPDDINAVDGSGYTALQIACERNQNNSLEIVKLLLRRSADPLKHEGSTKPTWRIAKENAVMWEVVKDYVPVNIQWEDYSSESDSETEDDFESAEEGDEDLTLQLLHMKVE